MTMVGDTPGEVRCPHEGVSNESDNVAHGSVRREGTMTRLMSDNPNTGKVQTLEPPIDTPKTPTKDLSTNSTERLESPFGFAGGVNVGSQVPKDSPNDEVSDTVAETSGGITNKVLGRNRGANVAKRTAEWGELRELILAVNLFLDSHD